MSFPLFRKKDSQFGGIQTEYAFVSPVGIAIASAGEMPNDIAAIDGAALPQLFCTIFRRNSGASGIANALARCESVVY
jgi:hypothetical protein